MRNQKAFKISLAVTNDLSTDQRVHRSCLALKDAGYSVELIGRELPNSMPINRDYPCKRMRLLFKKKAFFYAEYNLRLFLRLLFSDADLYYANDLDTLLACFCAARIKRKKLFYDAHEMFPEVPELTARPKVKRFWEKLEDFLLRKLSCEESKFACCTVCDSIADVYNTRYGLNMQVVRNTPVRCDYSSVTPVIEKDGKRVLLYQGAVNVGRGIEWVIDAMEYLQDFLFVIVGDGDEYENLVSYVKAKSLEGRVVFVGRVPFGKLKGYTKCADLGLCLLENRGLNYYYSLPNRIADFVQAEVPILATDFPEIRKVVRKYKVGTLVSDYSPRELANSISSSIASWDALSAEEKKVIFAKAQEDLCWENDEKVLKKLISGLLCPGLKQ